LPPSGANNKIELSEMMEIWQYAIPASWNKKLQEQVRIQSMTTAEFIEATEHIEGAEGDYEKVSQRTDKSSKKKLQKKESSGTKYCKLHGTNTTHTTPRTAKSSRLVTVAGTTKEKIPPSTRTRLGRVTALSQLRNQEGFSMLVNKAV
jgi:hypothetical protein